jgi:MoxR-like ATPase
MSSLVATALSVPEARIRRLIDKVAPLSSQQCAATLGELERRPAAGPLRPELVPFGFDSTLLRTRWAYDHVKWMVQKDALGQDMYLLGVHSPLRRWLVYRFCEVTSREVEYIALTRDTTEGDLKQRREIVGGGTVEWRDQSVVSAAIEGRVLLIEGLEKVERNVLPVLNNLLENREMQLEDGRFLVAPDRYDALKKELSQSELNDLSLVRVHEKFRVVAVGVPVPPFPGNPLDPPLRSRFQARHIDRVPTPPLFATLRAQYAPSVGERTVERLAEFYESLWALASIQADTSGVEARAMAFQKLSYPCEDALLSAAALLERFPLLPIAELVSRIFPTHCGLLEAEATKLVTQILAEVASEDDGDAAEAATTDYALVSIEATNSATAGSRPVEDSAPNISLTLATAGTGALVQVPCFGGNSAPVMPGSETSSMPVHPYHQQLLSRMLQSHAVGRDLCVVGGRGEGKSYIGRLFARALGYRRVETLFLFEDMTARDLLQRRTTTSAGITVWKNTPLMSAVETGRLCVLDGLDRLSPGTISVLLRLVQDREVTLFDGTRFVSPGRYQRMRKELGMQEHQLAAANVRPVHPAFCILCLAAPPERKGAGGGSRWLTNEILQLFHYFSVAPPVPLAAAAAAARGGAAADPYAVEVAKEKMVAAEYKFGISHTVAIVGAAVPECPKSLAMRLARARGALRALSDDATNQVSATLTLRHVLRIARRALAFPDELGATVESAVMSSFMPPAERAAVQKVLRHRQVQLLAPRSGEEQDDQEGEDEDHDGSPQVQPMSEAQLMEALERARTGVTVTKASLSPSSPEGVLTIGAVSIKVGLPLVPALVPSTVFFEIPKHTLVLEAMLKDLTIGDHLLLMGNQGVGKNKLTDYLLMLLHREREYIQLHRDTTVPALTLTPSMQGGVVVWEDSPLVKAMSHGRVLVIDEFDKAPAEVVIVLKALLEDGEILLGDGRRFVSSKSLLWEMDLPSDAASGVKRIHPEFRVIALANRPGYPFLGNDFFREMGDVFACHAVDNPDENSEFTLLQSYAPTVSAELLNMLIASFSELRQLVDQGRLSYPYSTRELVNVVRHLSGFPNDDIATVLENIFAFDAFDPQLRDTLFEVFMRHGIPLDASKSDAEKRQKEARDLTANEGEPLSEGDWAELSRFTR